MSYPPPLYRGTGGELTVSYRPAGRPPDIVNTRTGNQVHYLATGQSTGGKFGLYRWEMGPGESGPDPHFHRSITESFYVLEGSVAIFNGERWIDTGPGDWVHVPEGGIHGFKNRSGRPAAMLLHFAPGAPREEYFERVAQMRGHSDEERQAFFEKHDTYWVNGSG
jgi:mannose-6-phosphate isomerase-like protein (cupin superfamily)